MEQKRGLPKNTKTGNYVSAFLIVMTYLDATGVIDKEEESSLLPKKISKHKYKLN